MFLSFLRSGFFHILKRLFLTLIGTVFAFLLWVWIQEPKKSEFSPGETVSFEKSIEIFASRVSSIDVDPPPRIHQEVDYSEGSSAAWWPKGESPVLSELVREGKLPPVAERVGPEPVVLEGVEGIGKYGGVWLDAVTSDKDQVWDWMNRYMGGVTLLRWSPNGYPIVPHVAKKYEVSPDNRIYTIHLRKGMKWSDGHPFTVNDMLYWWKHEFLYGQEVEAFLDPDGDRVLRVGKSYCELEKIDDTTMRFVFPVPNPFFLEVLAGTPVKFLFSPGHYMEKFHPELGDQDLIDRITEEQGFFARHQVYTEMMREDNPEYPRINPWIIRRYKVNPPQSFVRNPYYWGVDSQGNQLPYIDQVQVKVDEPEVYKLSIAQGGYPAVFSKVTFNDYALMAAGQKTYGYKIHHYYSGSRGGGAFVLWLNQNRNVRPGDSMTLIKSKLLQKKEFRQALSVALNRQSIIDAEFNGYGEPAQVAPPKESPFYSEKMFKSYTQYDPDLANKLLDKAGLTFRDSDGFRMTEEGIPLFFYLTKQGKSPFKAEQFIIDDWAEVGVRVVPKPTSLGIYIMERMTRQFDMAAGGSYTEFIPVVEPKVYVPVDNYCMFGPAFGSWYSAVSKGTSGNLNDLRMEEPPVGHPVRSVIDLYDQAMQAPTREDAFSLFNDILEIAAEEVFTINITTPPPVLVVAKDGFRNVPKSGIAAGLFRTPTNLGVETFYFDSFKVSEGKLEEIRDDLLGKEMHFELTASVSEENAVTGSGSGMGKLIKTLFLVIFFLAVILVGVKNPYIGRRLLLFIPILILVSVITFIIIEIPPGNIIETRLLNLEETGSAASQEEIARLRKDFGLDDPGIIRYARWLGLPWFLSYTQGDKGLLQGDLGLSLEDPRRPRPVNEIVGDRILMTVLIALGTILLTWTLAIPIGIFSAVRQYSIMDYVLTFLGFIGMCIPGFLLALLVIYWGGKYFNMNLTGLFSSEYAIQPDWSWGKFTDLLKHIWVPVLILGVTGTAGMIRVMRGNLLDELRKPYVITAKAKGVRPFKLLMKYPVRIAINPFISTIGTLFPQLVSGGAIVAVVLGLPTVGPLLLNALLNEDIYLAGSMLVVLSLLGITGTLVSDLMLMWLDPRIRMEGSKK